jgi:hypothetical protein
VLSWKTPPSGPVAQAVEHLPFKQRVAGSSPARLTNLQTFAPTEPPKNQSGFQLSDFFGTTSQSLPNPRIRTILTSRNTQGQSVIGGCVILPFTATLDHVTPVAERGDNSLENLVTACGA